MMAKSRKTTATKNKSSKLAPKDNLTKRLSRLYTGALHDVMRGRGLRDCTLPPTIRSQTVQKTIAGPAFTLLGRVDRNADPHQSLLDWTGFLSKSKPNHVVVIQASDSEVAHMGELSGEVLMKKGIPGCVIDGGTRDVSFLIDMKMPVYARYTTPRDIVGYWLVGGLDVPIRIGLVTINPGDYILADHDGVIVLPKARAEEIITAAETASKTENKIRIAILGGMDPQQAYLKYGKF
ncbi:MAG: RraA family protein [Pseudorhodoplanes sp.]